MLSIKELRRFCLKTTTIFFGFIASSFPGGAFFSLENAIIMRGISRVPLHRKAPRGHPSASSSMVSSRKLTGRKPSLQEIIADFGSFIQPS